jgi:AcrR family transcriptional regulator
MPKQTTRAYSRITRHAAALLGKQIKIARKERKMTVQDLADRAGISRGLLWGRQFLNPITFEDLS